MCVPTFIYIKMFTHTHHKYKEMSKKKLELETWDISKDSGLKLSQLKCQVVYLFFGKSFNKIKQQNIIKHLK